jgi:hypothetical protein
MGLIFNRGDDELEEQVEKLSKKVNRLQNELNAVRTDKDILEERVGNIPDYVEASIERKSGIDEQGISRLPELEDTVFTLAEPHVGWKHAQGYIVKLLLPEDADVVYPEPWPSDSDSYNPYKKLRASEAEVLDIQTFDRSGKAPNRVCSNHDSSFEYRVGRAVYPHGFDTNTAIHCTGGIHLYATRKAAVDTM